MISAPLADQALQGTYCPKMCHFACPVLAATGNERDAPWGLHSTVSALARDQRPADGAAYRDLRGCTGCHRCREACLFRQDVPEQVRAGRAAVVAAGSPPPVVAEVAHRVRAGRTPEGHAAAEPPARRDGVTTTVVGSCADDMDALRALDGTLLAAGEAPDWVVPDGCCGGVPTDLGLDRVAAERREALRARLTGRRRIVGTDPHCLPSLRASAPPDAEVLHVAVLLAELTERGALERNGALPKLHGACVVERDEPAAAAASRRALRTDDAADVCSGAGLGFDLLAPAAANAVASRASEELGAISVTTCPRARRHLAAAGIDVGHLWSALRPVTDGEAAEGVTEVVT